MRSWTNTGWARRAMLQPRATTSITGVASTSSTDPRTRSSARRRRSARRCAWVLLLTRQTYAARTPYVRMESASSGSSRLVPDRRRGRRGGPPWRPRRTARPGAGGPVRPAPPGARGPRGAPRTASAAAAGSPTGTRRPVTPGSTASRLPTTSVRTTAVRARIASSGAYGTTLEPRREQEHLKCTESAGRPLQHGEAVQHPREPGGIDGGVDGVGQGAVADEDEAHLRPAGVHRGGGRHEVQGRLLGHEAGDGPDQGHVGTEAEQSPEVDGRWRRQLDPVGDRHHAVAGGQPRVDDRLRLAGRHRDHAIGGSGQRPLHDDPRPDVGDPVGRVGDGAPVAHRRHPRRRPPIELWPWTTSGSTRRTSVRRRASATALAGDHGRRRIGRWWTTAPAARRWPSAASSVTPPTRRGGITTSWSVPWAWRTRSTTWRAVPPSSASSTWSTRGGRPAFTNRRCLQIG